MTTRKCVQLTVFKKLVGKEKSLKGSSKGTDRDSVTRKTKANGF